MKEKVLAIGEAISVDVISALVAAGFRVEVAQDYPQGLRRLDETSPDLVIIDEMLPGVNGWEACSRFRQVSDVPVILLGADRSGEAVAKAIDQGADAYMVKPISTNELEARVNALFRRYQEKETVDDSRGRKGTGTVPRPDRQDYRQGDY